MRRISLCWSITAALRASRTITAALPLLAMAVLLGMALLARRQGITPLGSWLLAGLYALSPFLIYRVTEGIPTLLASLSWAPWCWLCWLFGGPLLLAAAWALQFLAGIPSTYRRKLLTTLSQ